MNRTDLPEDLTKIDPRDLQIRIERGNWGALLTRLGVQGPHDHHALIRGGDEIGRLQGIEEIFVTIKTMLGNKDLTNYEVLGMLGSLITSNQEPEPNPNEWMQTYHNQAFYPFNPDPAAIDIDEIAWSLSMQVRYTGHASRFYSVAKHCVHVSKCLPEEYALWGLLHDAAEYAFGDIARPIKGRMKEYKKYETRLMQVIAEKYGLVWPEPSCVKAINRRILTNERLALFGAPPQPWDTDDVPLSIEIQC